MCKCVYCGVEIPEGRQVCHTCEYEQLEMVKKENESLRQNCVTHGTMQALLADARKETAKAILQELSIMQDACYKDDVILSRLCKKYGVKLEG